MKWYIVLFIISVITMLGGGIAMAIVNKSHNDKKPKVSDSVFANVTGLTQTDIGYYSILNPNQPTLLPNITETTFDATTMKKYNKKKFIETYNIWDSDKAFKMLNTISLITLILGGVLTGIFGAIWWANRVTSETQV